MDGGVESIGGVSQGGYSGGGPSRSDVASFNRELANHGFGDASTNPEIGNHHGTQGKAVNGTDYATGSPYSAAAVRSSVHAGMITLMEPNMAQQINRVAETTEQTATQARLKGSPITSEQLELAQQDKFIAFWETRMKVNDPIARTALLGWKPELVKDASWVERAAAAYVWDTLEEEIQTRGLNVTMEQIGKELAKAHAYAVIEDAESVPNLLSPEQVANYHHKVFGKYKIPPDKFGGTFLGNDPNLYSSWWCGGCDTKP